MKKKGFKGLSVALLALACGCMLTACGEEKKPDGEDGVVTPGGEGGVTTTPGADESGVQDSKTLLEKWNEQINSVKTSATLKQPGYNNPLMTQRLGADPYAMEYDGRIYIYMTGDVPEYNPDGSNKDNTYSKVNTLCVISSDDLVNWTDHGTIYAADMRGGAKWGKNSWAPAACCKEIDGQMKFFLYFANGGNGIGVLTADSPVGPFTDPIKKPLVSRGTPTCDKVEWLFDPAVLVDEDGSAYLYFGGGIPNQQFAHPMTARVVKLGADMISLDGDPQIIDAPYLFEDSGINRIGDTYYYSYCTNWNVDDAGKKEYGIDNAQIVYMTSDNPMGPFTYQRAILKNPGNYFGVYGNNHHCMFSFQGQYYMTYHSQILEKPMGIGGGYRCTHIDKVTVNEDGSIAMGEGTKFGVPQLKEFDPYQKVEAETIWTMGGINTTQYGQTALLFGAGNMVVTDISDGDWLALSDVAFGDDGATKFNAQLVLGEAAKGAILVRLDSLTGEDVGVIEITGEAGEVTLTTELAKKVTGTHDVYFIFLGEDYQWDSWSMEH